MRGGKPFPLCHPKEDPSRGTTRKKSKASLKKSSDLGLSESSDKGKKSSSIALRVPRREEVFIVVHGSKSSGGKGDNVRFGGVTAARREEEGSSSPLKKSSAVKSEKSSKGVPLLIEKKTFGRRRKGGQQVILEEGRLRGGQQKESKMKKKGRGNSEEEGKQESDVDNPTYNERFDMEKKKTAVLEWKGKKELGRLGEERRISIMVWGGVFAEGKEGKPVEFRKRFLRKGKEKRKNRERLSVNTQKT